MFVCESCECETIQQKMWVDLETDNIESRVEPEEYYCPDCEESIKPIDVGNYMKWHRITEASMDHIKEGLESIAIVVNDEDTDFDLRCCYAHSVMAGDLSI